MSIADTDATLLSYAAGTYAAGRALQRPTDDCVVDDWRFMENWQRQASPSLGAMLRAGQIRRANPVLVAAIEAEVNRRS